MIRDILRTFFASHDPTQLNRQGDDIGSQYRSIVLYHTESQYYQARMLIKELNQQAFDGKIVTQIAKYKSFFKAEQYHINYYNINPEENYCNFTVRPKVMKAKKFIKEQGLGK